MQAHLGLDAPHARRAGRIAFGAVLIAGALVLARSALREDWTAGHAWQLILGSWLLAFAAVPLARLIAGLFPARPNAWRAAALVVPSVGIALLLPLTIHMPFVLRGEHAVRDFDDWCEWSLLITGATHVVFALLVAARAAALARGREPIQVASIYGATVLVSCVPFMLLYLIPPVLVALTGLPIVPLLILMKRVAAADHEPELPVAIAKVAKVA